MMLKRFFLQGFFLLCAASLLWAQAATDELQVKLRTASRERGTVLVREYGPLGEMQGEFGSVMFDTLVVTYVEQGNRQVKGIQAVISMPSPGDDTGKAASFVADEELGDDTSVYLYIDEDEIAMLSSAITKMLALVEKWDGKKAEKETSITTRDDLSITISTGERGQSTSIYGYDGDAAFMVLKSPEHLLTIKGFLDKGLKQLSAAR